MCHGAYKTGIVTLAPKAHMKTYIDFLDAEESVGVRAFEVGGDERQLADQCGCSREV
jgi:hypothetical protein